MANSRSRHRGFLVIELIVGLSILALLLGGLAYTLNGFAAFNRRQLVRQQCTAAAQAQLDSIAVTGKPLEKEELETLWPGIAVSLAQSAGAGQWQGLRLVEVEAAEKKGAHRVRVKLQRYTATQEQE